MDDTILHTDSPILRMGSPFLHVYSPFLHMYSPILHMNSSVVVTGAQALYPQLLPHVEPPCQALPRYFVPAIPNPSMHERRRRGVETKTDVSTGPLETNAPSVKCNAK